MECFLQIFRCIKAPFTRNQGKIIEIGPPTNFRKEELPACFSDAESVLSPSQTPTRRNNLTSQPQYVDAPEQPRNNDGERRNDDRDDPSSPVRQGEDSEPCEENERPTLKAHIRDRMRRCRWLKSKPTTDPEKEVVSEDSLFSIAKEKAKDT